MTAPHTLSPPAADSVSDAWRLSLPGTDGQRHSLSSLAGARATVVIFVGNGCPTVRAYEAERNFNFPYLKDGEGVLAKAFGAICTPHAFVLDSERRVVYSGRIDDSRLGDRITSKDLENAVDDIVAGRPMRVPHTDPFGCSIVW